MCCQFCESNKYVVLLIEEYQSDSVSQGGIIKILFHENQINSGSGSCGQVHVSL